MTSPYKKILDPDFDYEEDGRFKAQLKSAIEERIEEMARIKAGGVRPPLRVTIKGTPFIDPDTIAAVEMPEDFGKWA